MCRTSPGRRVAIRKLSMGIRRYKLLIVDRPFVLPKGANGPVASEMTLA